jgi:hypothetical protein
MLIVLFGSRQSGPSGLTLGSRSKSNMVSHMTDTGRGNNSQILTLLHPVTAEHSLVQALTSYEDSRVNPMYLSAELEAVRFWKVTLYPEGV